MKKTILVAAVMAVGGLISACAPPGGGAPANVVPVATIAPSATSGVAPLAVVLDASDSVDPDGSIVSYAWDFGDGTTGAGDIVTHVFGEGTWQAKLTVTDNGGAVGTATVEIVVTNQAPVATIVASATSGTAPLTVTLDGTGSVDPDGTVASYAWTITDQAPSTAATVARTFAPGTYVVTLTVTDLAGKTGTASTTITVNGTPAAPTGLTKVGSGLIPGTWGDFTWNPVPGADAYRIEMDPTLGCALWPYSNTTAEFSGQVSSGRVQHNSNLCLGTRYDVRIQARANGVWSPWSPKINLAL